MSAGFSSMSRTYHNEVYLLKKFFVLLCPGVEGGGLCIDGWVDGLKMKLWLTPGI